MNLPDRLKYLLIPASLHAANLHRRLARREPELGLLPWLVPRSRVAVDVGANKGAYTRALLALAASVHAFEPNPALLPWLRRIHSPRLTVHARALGARDGAGTLRIPLSRKGQPSKQRATLARPAADARYVESPTEVRRLDSFDIGDVGFVKIDVEGYESEVIAGAEETIARCRPTLLVEIEEKHRGESPRTTIDNIDALGYRCHVLVDGALTDARRFEITPAMFNWIFLPR